MDRRYAPLDPRSYGPATPAEAAVQVRQAGTGRVATGTVPALTPEQIATLIDEGREASFAVTNARMQLETLRRERAKGGLLSQEAQWAEDKLKYYFDSATDATLGAVDANLRGAERDLRAPGADYFRSFTAPETVLHRQQLAKDGKGYTALQNPEHSSNTVAVNYPAYSRDPKAYRLEAQIHENGHVRGPRLAEGEELNGIEAIKKARTAGGTAWAVNRNPDNTALFVLGRRPIFEPVPRLSRIE